MEEHSQMDLDETSSNDGNDDIIINERDGLPNIHPNYNGMPQLQSSELKQNPDDATSLDEMIRDEDLPTSLIVTNLDSVIFTNEDRKNEIKEIFSEYGEPTSFQFFRSFRRMRVNYRCPTAAANARLGLHQTQIGETIMNCYFAQPVSPIDLDGQHLKAPALTKQFLISPPASPPVGWAPREEGEPLVNYDLLAAIANLTPGETHELHPPVGGKPGIVVHVCEESLAAANSTKRIGQTRCPVHEH